MVVRPQSQTNLNSSRLTYGVLGSELSTRICLPHSGQRGTLRTDGGSGGRGAGILPNDLPRWSQTRISIKGSGKIAAADAKFLPYASAGPVSLSGSVTSPGGERAVRLPPRRTGHQVSVHRNTP